MGNLTRFTFFDTHSCHSLTAKADCTQKSHFSQSTRCGQDKTKFPYPATVPLLFLHPKLTKIGNPAPARCQNSRFPLLFYARIPRITTKKQPNPASRQIYCRPSYLDPQLYLLAFHRFIYASHLVRLFNVR